MWKWKSRQHSLAPTEEQIRAKAYELWQQRGLGHSDEDNWEDAIKALAHERSLSRLSKRLSAPIELWDKSPKPCQKFFPTLQIAWNWAGISEKKGWDWIQLLLVPIFLAMGGFYLNQQASDRQNSFNQQRHEQDQALAAQNAEKDRKLADDKAKQDTLVKYLDQMADSLKDGLLEAKPGTQRFILAQARTVIALQSLDGKRQHLIIQYLQATGLNQVIGKLRLNKDGKFQYQVIRNFKFNKDGKLQLGESDRALLYGAQMGKANLTKSDLSGASLMEANLVYADLRNAILGNAVLSGANLGFADLSGADLTYADLSNAYLIGTHLSGAGLEGANISGAVLVGTDLTQAEKLTQQQLEGQDPVLLCHVRLPQEFTVDPNRDCKKLPQILLDRYPRNFKDLATAQAFVDTNSKP